MTDLAIAHVVFDCADAGALAEFYSALLDRPVDPGPTPYFATVGKAAKREAAKGEAAKREAAKGEAAKGEATGAGPALMFIQVPDRTPGKNRIHLDLHTTDLPAQVSRAIGLGAKQVADFAEYGAVWTTLADPEGNLFDIGTPAAGA